MTSITIFSFLCAVFVIVIVLYGLHYFITKIIEHSFLMITIQKQMLEQFIKLNAFLDEQKRKIES